MKYILLIVLFVSFSSSEMFKIEQSNNIKYYPKEGYTLIGVKDKNGSYIIKDSIDRHSSPL